MNRHPGQDTLDRLNAQPTAAIARDLTPEEQRVMQSALVASTKLVVPRSEAEQWRCELMKGPAVLVVPPLDGPHDVQDLKDWLLLILRRLERNTAQ